MEPSATFGAALRKLRARQGLSQDDFALVSSRTYISQLERELKSPTVEKIDQLAAFMGVHPASLMVGSYLESWTLENIETLFDQIRRDLIWRDTTEKGQLETDE